MAITNEQTVPRFSPVIVPPSGVPALLAQMTAHVVGIQLATRPTSAEDIPALFRMIHEELASIAGAEPTQASARPEIPDEAKAAGQVDATRWPGVFPDRIVCLEDGRDVTLLRSYISRRHGMSVSEYLRRWRLPADYPMVPSEYAARKRSIAQRSGLGTSVRANKERRGRAAS